MRYSVIVPVNNEEGNISQLDKEIKAVMDKLDSYEIIYINDGSTDNSLNELKKLKRATIINLNRNYGQSIALDAGFKKSQGEIVISIDGDLQNDPQDIPKLLEKLEKDTGEISKKTAGDTQIAMLADSHESFDNLLKAVERINKDENSRVLLIGRVEG